MPSDPSAQSTVASSLERALRAARIPEAAWPDYLTIGAELAAFTQQPVARWRLVDVARFYSLRQPVLDDGARARYRSALALVVEMLAGLKGASALEREFELADRAFRDAQTGLTMPTFVRVAIDHALSAPSSDFDDLLPATFAEEDSALDPEIAGFLDGMDTEDSGFARRPSTAGRSNPLGLESRSARVGSDSKSGSDLGSGFGSDLSSGFGSDLGSGFGSDLGSGFGSGSDFRKDPLGRDSRAGSGFESRTSSSAAPDAESSTLARVKSRRVRGRNESDASGGTRPLGFGSSGRRATFSTTNLPAVRRSEHVERPTSNRGAGLRWSPAGWGELTLEKVAATQQLDRILRAFVNQLANQSSSAAILIVESDALHASGAAWFLDWLKTCASQGITRVALVSDDPTAERLGVGRLEHESSRLGSVKMPTRAEVCAFDHADDARAWLRRVLRR